MIRPLMERIMSRVVYDNTGCWVFTGSRSEGYGVIGRGPRGAGNVYVHRAVFEHQRGSIPVGLDLDHLCRNRACCNPCHLQAVDRRTNALRGIRWIDPPTHCPHGHEYTPDNTYISKRKRRCRECQAEAYRRKVVLREVVA